MSDFRPGDEVPKIGLKFEASNRFKVEQYLMEELDQVLRTLASERPTEDGA